MLKYLSHCFTNFSELHWTIQLLTYSAIISLTCYLALICKP